METAGKGVLGAMEREVSLEDISDGKLYGINDMVRADSGGCEGCSACCRGMGSSIILDPLDMFRLTVNLGMTPEQLLSGPLEVNMVDGIILPNIRMTGRDEACSFLNGEGRCGIHSYRPGFCRLFPLGRLYENRSFSYFLITAGKSSIRSFTGGLQRLLSLRHVPELKPAFKSGFRISTNGQEEDSYGIRCSIEGKKKHEKVPAGQESEP